MVTKASKMRAVYKIRALQVHLEEENIGEEVIEDTEDGEVFLDFSACNIIYKVIQLS